MSHEKLQEILQLPYDEKIEIYEALVNDLHKENGLEEELNESQKQELDRRLKKIEDGEAKFFSWDEVERRLRNRK
ncbi:MAG TPA: addiction module protein [Chitinophagales bacterium]|nr:addiction module protein [Chitinophagales bacterium]